jgi:HAE1 family hydrophobic/amphiphilic exporter-1
MRDITLKFPDMTIDQLRNMTISAGQRNIRLDEITTITSSVGEKEIIRNNQVRLGKLSAQISGDVALDRVAERIRAVLAEMDFPPNYSFEISGEDLKRRQSFSDLKFALLLSIILIYMVMASQFESLIHPFTILLTIPLATVGAILIFYFLGMALNVMAYIGIILLVGIAVNDSIILVDAINQLKRQGLTLRDAIIEAGQRRIRPIIMTSLTTILALLPLTFGFGESAALRAPMALAVIGGLVTSTLLTLVVIPCVYFTFEQLTQQFKHEHA